MPGSLHFGVQVCVLTSKVNPVPKVLEMLLVYVELNGLYTEGIYRKSGSTCRAKELHQILETGKRISEDRISPEMCNVSSWTPIKPVICQLHCRLRPTLQY